MGFHVWGLGITDFLPTWSPSDVKPKLSPRLNMIIPACACTTPATSTTLAPLDVSLQLASTVRELSLPSGGPLSTERDPGTRAPSLGEHVRMTPAKSAPFSMSASMSSEAGASLVEIEGRLCASPPLAEKTLSVESAPAGVLEKLTLARVAS